MADGIFPGIVSATRDANLVTNPIFVKLTDGTTAVTLTGSSVNVNITGGSVTATVDFDYATGTAAGATDVGAYILVIRDDALTTLADADGDYVGLRVDSTGRLWVSSNSTEYAIDTVAGGADLGTLALVVRDDALTTLTPADGDYTQVRVDSTGATWVRFTNTTISVTATDLDIRDLTLALDAVKISGNSTANSIVNPIFVQNVDTQILGQEIHNYSTATPAGDAASNHDYTVVGTTFLLKSVIGSCSGAMKLEIQTGPVASLVTKAVVFLNARQGDTKQVFFDPPIEVPVTSTGTVRVIRTNRNSSATDVYSTIIGNDVA